MVLQVLRSVGFWSAGTSQPEEKSIHTAYCSLIDKAEYFIYIEVIPSYQMISIYFSGLFCILFLEHMSQVVIWLVPFVLSIIFWIFDIS